MGNSFVQDMMSGGGGAGGAGAVMYSPILRRLLGGEPEVETPGREIPYDSSQPWSREGLERRLDYEYNDDEGNSLVGDDRLTGIMGRIAAHAPANATPEELEAFAADQRAAAVELGAMRGQSEEEALKGYDRFRELQAEQARMREERGLDPIEDLDMTTHGDHMGSIQQLRFGSYVGEALGVDDVYGALLNPTGGLVGEGNSGYSADPNSVASFHGEAHDAFGYLANYHDVGPGYMYASPEEAQRYGGSDPAMLRPYTGQASGFTLWNDILESHGRHDPHHPNNPQEQMRESLSTLGHGDMVDPQQRDPIRVGWNPTPGFPDDNPTVPNPLDGRPLLGPIPQIVETVEGLIHGIGDIASHPEWLLM